MTLSQMPARGRPVQVTFDTFTSFPRSTAALMAPGIAAATRLATFTTFSTEAVKAGPRMARWYCAIGGEEVNPIRVRRTSEGPLERAWACPVHGAQERMLYVEDPEALSRLIQLYSDAPPARTPPETVGGLLREFRAKLDGYCYGCEKWQTTQGSFYYCASRQRETGELKSARPRSCPKKEVGA